MISFKTKDETTMSAVILSAVFVILCIALFMMFGLPSNLGIQQAKLRAKNQVVDEIKDLDKRKVDYTNNINAMTWTLPVEQIGPKALDSVTAIAVKQHVKLVGFRPQKANEVNGLTQLPIAIALEGSYPALMKFIGDLEKSDLRVATSTIQIASTDTTSDLVSATVGVVAYRPLDTKPASKEQPNAKKEN